MKKKFIILLAIITIISVSLFTACGEDEEQPKNQSVTITNLFGEGFSATVKGHMKDSEWSGVADKIETAFNGAYAAGSGTVKARFTTAFENNNVVITVDKTAAYANWKTTGNKTELYLNIDALDNIQSKLFDAVTAMRDEISTTAKIFVTHPSTFLT